MAPDKFKRKLAAILSLDVKGDSHMIGEDEERTLQTLNDREGAMTHFIQQYQGWVMGSA